MVPFCHVSHVGKELWENSGAHVKKSWNVDGSLNELGGVGGLPCNWNVAELTTSLNNKNISAITCKDTVLKGLACWVGGSPALPIPDEWINSNRSLDANGYLLDDWSASPEKNTKYISFAIETPIDVSTANMIGRYDELKTRKANSNFDFDLHELKTEAGSISLKKDNPIWLLCGMGDASANANFLLYGDVTNNNKGVCVPDIGIFDIHSSGYVGESTDSMIQVSIFANQSGNGLGIN